MEGGYCVDTNYHAKLHEKEQQHSNLQSALEAYDYNTMVLTYILGFYGTAYLSNLSTLKTLGMRALQLTSCAEKYMHTLCLARTTSLRLGGSERFLSPETISGGRDKGLTPLIVFSLLGHSC